MLFSVNLLFALVKLNLLGILEIDRKIRHPFSLVEALLSIYTFINMYLLHFF